MRLGTEATGRDVWSRLLYGSRVSLIVGFSVALTGANRFRLAWRSARLIGPAPRFELQCFYGTTSFELG